MTPRRPRPPARSPTAEIRPVAGPEELERARELFTEYVASIRPARFASPPAHVVEEIAGLPGAYRPPAGTLLLAWDGATAVGAVGVRPLRDGRGELKHLYVRAPARARGLGRALVLAAVEFAARAGYAELVLDTLPEMAGAIALYASLGFHEVRAYWPNPVEDARFFALALPAARTT